VLEDFRAAEETTLVNRHLFTSGQPGFNELDTADQIGKLEELVVLGANGLRKFDTRAKLCLKGVVQEIRNRSLSAIVIELDALELVSIQGRRVEKFLELRLKLLDDLANGCHELLVDKEAMI